MPLKPHPTDPDKMIYVSPHYDLPYTPTARDMLSQQGQKKDGWELGTWPAEVAVKLEEISHLVDYAAKLAKEVEWLYSGDTGEDTFMERVEKINSP